MMTQSARLVIWACVAVLALVAVPAASAGLTSASELAGTLLQDHGYVLTAEQKQQLDKINRELREAEKAFGREQNDKNRNRLTAARKQLTDLLTGVDELQTIKADNGKVVPSIRGPHQVPGDVTAFLFRFDAGEGDTSFSVYNMNEALPEFRKGLWIDVAAEGTTWILVGMYNLPKDRMIVPVQFRANDKALGKDLLDVRMQPRGEFVLTVLSDDDGKSVPSMVRITSKRTGRDRKPANAIELTDQFDENGWNSSNRNTNLPGNLGGRWWCVPEPCRMTLPPGQYDIAIRRGTEHVPIFESFSITSNKLTAKAYKPRRWVDMRDHKWYSGDDHVHCQILSDADARDLMAWVRAEDVHVANVVKMGDIARTYFEQRGFGKDYRVIADDYVLSPGQECPRTHQQIGHTLSMNTTSMVRNTDKYYLYDLIADEVHRQGGLWGYAHVNSGMFFVHRDMTMNIPRGNCDFVELLQFSRMDPQLYYDFLNTGFKVTAAAGSDVPWGGTIGEVRVYAKVEKEFSADAWFDAVRQGHTFVTNGPMVDLRVNDALPGDTLTFDSNARIKVKARTWGHPERSRPSKLEIIVHGQPIKTFEAEDNSNEIKATFELPVDNGFWIAARVHADNGTQAHTTPVYIERKGLRWWKFDEIDDLIQKRLTSLDEIETIVNEARQQQANDEIAGDNREIMELARQSDQLMERVELARKTYASLQNTAKKEQALRSASR